MGVQVYWVLFFITDNREIVQVYILGFIFYLKTHLLPHRMIEDYSVLLEALWADDDAGDFRLLVEPDIGGRPIPTFKLTTPIEVRSRDSGTRFVDVVKILSPKDGSPYPLSSPPPRPLVLPRPSTPPLAPAIAAPSSCLVHRLSPLPPPSPPPSPRRRHHRRPCRAAAIAALPPSPPSSPPPSPPWGRHCLIVS